jgi:hypothetical protein
LFLGIFVLLGACNDSKNTTLSTPQLKILSTTVVPSPMGHDSLVWVDLIFEDQDGDLGLSESDTMGGFAYGKYDFQNLKVYMHYCKDGIWHYALNPITGNTDTITFHERLPRLSAPGKNKKVTGEMRLIIPAKPYGFVTDSVRFTLRISDRMLHRSGWEISPVARLKH